VSAATVIVGYIALAILRHGCLDLIEAGAEAGSLYGVQSRECQGEL
jgi:hypothetical protein